MIGNIGLYLALFAAVASALLFLTNRDTKATKVLVIIHGLGLAIAFSYLIYALMTHQFQYQYVYSHTDLSLSPGYLFSAVWAGQEGSYLFWALCGGLVAILLVYKEKGRFLIPFYMVAQIFLLVFLVADSPFQLASCVHTDGSGMNPLLLDPWMIIHPPVIFISYALLLVPMVFSLDSLLRKDYQGLLKSLPWAIAGWLFLGAGIFIGGAWAYRVLGWGGYWAWDPVENSSLIPWLTSTALVHGLLMQKGRGYFLRVNHFLAIITYLLVILATFITRSGIMANYSVHSFAQTPLATLLTTFLVVFSVAGLTIFAIRYTRMDAKTAKGIELISRSGAIGITMVILCVSGVLTLLGTLSPIVTGWFGSPASVDQSFYHQVNGPLAVLLMALLGIFPYLREKGQLGDFSFSIGAFSIALVVLSAFGLRHPVSLLFIGVAVFALASNLGHLVSGWRRQGFVATGGAWAHLGIVLMLLGVYVSTNFTISETFYLHQGQAVESLGYAFTWQGEEGGDLHILVEGGPRSKTVAGRIYYVGSRQMREPGIMQRFFHDIYISPIQMAKEFENQIVIHRGGHFSYQDYSIQFRDFVTHRHEDGEMKIGAELVVRHTGDVQTIIPAMRVVDNQQEFIGATLPHTDVSVYLQAMDAEQGFAWFTIGEAPCPGEDVLAVEVKKKPFIAILGLGVLLLLGGTSLALWRRLK